MYPITYKTLLTKVWQIIQDHEHREAMEEVLFQELENSENGCFKGRFIRTLNALSGFIDEVQVGMNSGEQMQNQIVVVIKTLQKRLGKNYLDEARKQIKDILIDFNVPEEDHNAWLDAVDYAPWK
jgi:hypothetical protein